MDTFPKARRRDEKEHNGDYCPRRIILKIYDALQKAIRTLLPRPIPPLLTPANILPSSLNQT